MARPSRQTPLPPADEHPDDATYAPPLTVSHRALLNAGGDVAFRETLYLMVLAFGRLQACREAFGRALDLTGSQFAVLIGTAYRQGKHGVSIRALADHIQLASTHVTTEVGRLIRMGLLTKKINARDRRGVLVRLSPRGEAVVAEVAPFVRRVNDLLFAHISRDDLASLSRCLSTFALNSEYALADIRRSESERAMGHAAGARGPTHAGRIGKPATRARATTTGARDARSRLNSPLRRT
jgi:DNA-binding MarR family transcriptional regulator